MALLVRTRKVRNLHAIMLSRSISSDTLPAFVRRARKKDGREKQGGRGEDDGFCLGMLELYSWTGLVNG